MHISTEALNELTLDLPDVDNIYVRRLVLKLQSATECLGVLPTEHKLFWTWYYPIELLLHVSGMDREEAERRARAFCGLLFEEV